MGGTHQTGTVFLGSDTRMFLRLMPQPRLFSDPESTHPPSPTERLFFHLGETRYSKENTQLWVSLKQ